MFWVLFLSSEIWASNFLGERNGLIAVPSENLKSIVFALNPTDWSSLVKKLLLNLLLLDYWENPLSPS